MHFKCHTLSLLKKLDISSYRSKTHSNEMGPYPNPNNMNNIFTNHKDLYSMTQFVTQTVYSKFQVLSLAEILSKLKKTFNFVVL